SIFGLEPATHYECRFILTDPDGVVGDTIQQVVIRTKDEPKPYEHGRVFHVYPPGYEGPKDSPAFTGLNEAYYGGGNTGDWRSEEHTSELQSRENLVCRLLLEKK